MSQVVFLLILGQEVFLLGSIRISFYRIDVHYIFQEINEPKVKRCLI